MGLETAKRKLWQELRAQGIKSEAVLAAMQNVARESFLAPEYRAESYSNCPLPIGLDQTISQPYIVAFMTEVLQLGPQDRVLEVGTGCGYQTAVLAQLVSEVYTVEIREELQKFARNQLEVLANVHFRVGDGALGWPEFAPFDAILVTAAPAAIPKALKTQLKIGGRMVIPVGKQSQALHLITRTESGFDRQNLFPVRFVPMVNPS